MCFIPGTVHLGFEAMHMPVPIPKNKRSNKHVLVVEYEYFKSIVNRTFQMTSTHNANFISDFWIDLLEIPSLLLTDEGPYMVWKFSSFVRRYLGTKQLVRSSYHPQQNYQLKSITNKRSQNIHIPLPVIDGIVRVCTPLTLTSHYWLPMELCMFIDPLKFEYNSMIQRNVNAFRYSLVLLCYLTKQSLYSATTISLKIITIKTSPRPMRYVHQKCLHALFV